MPGRPRSATNIHTTSDPLGWIAARQGVPSGYVRLACDDPPLNLLVLLGEQPPRVTGGVGGWDVTARPRQVGMTTWQGVEPFELELSLLFDGWTSSPYRTQETSLRRLMRVGRGDDESPPGQLTIEGLPLLPADEWVIDSIDYGDAILRTSDMERVRQPVTLTLREYVPPEYKQLRRRALQGSKGKTKVVTCKRGDTPARIAKRVHCKWTQIRDLNRHNVRKANQVLKAGTKLRVPVASTKRKRRSSSGKGQRKR
jgi:hypothetical protein